MKLYGIWTSPYTRKIRILATAAGVPFELVDVRTEAGAAAHARVAPLGKVPVVELAGGEVLPDSGLIAAYLWHTYRDALSAAGFALSSDAFGDRAMQEVVDGTVDAANARRHLLADGFEDRATIATQGDRARASLLVLEERVRFARPIGHAVLSLGCGLDWMVFREVVDLTVYPGLTTFRNAWHGSGVGRGTEPTAAPT